LLASSSSVVHVRVAAKSGERGQARRFQLGVHKVAGAAAEELSHAGRRAAASRPAVERQGGALTLAAHVRVARRGTVHAAELDVAREGEHLLERRVRADAEHANRCVERHWSWVPAPSQIGGLFPLVRPHAIGR